MPKLPNDLDISETELTELREWQEKFGSKMGLDMALLIQFPKYTRFMEGLPGNKCPYCGSNNAFVYCDPPGNRRKYITACRKCNLVLPPSISAEEEKRRKNCCQ